MLEFIKKITGASWKKNIAFTTSVFFCLALLSSMLIYFLPDLYIYHSYFFRIIFFLAGLLVVVFIAIESFFNRIIAKNSFLFIFLLSLITLVYSEINDFNTVINYRHWLIGFIIGSGSIFSLLTPTLAKKVGISSYPTDKNQFLPYIIAANLILIFIALHHINIGLQGDEIFQGNAIKQIAQKGIPLFDSGILYTRGILVSYLGAIFYLIFNSIEVATRLPNLIFGLILLNFLFYQLKLHYRMPPIVIGLSLLFLNPWFINLLKISRLYIPLTATTILILFFLHKSLTTQNKLRYFLIAILIFILSLFIHKGIFMLAPILVAVSLILYFQLKHEGVQFWFLCLSLMITFLSSAGLIIFTKNSRLFDDIKNLAWTNIFSFPPDPFSFFYMVQNHPLVSVLGLTAIISSLIFFAVTRKLEIASFLAMSALSIFLFQSIVKVSTQPRYYLTLFTILTILSIYTIDKIYNTLFQYRSLKTPFIFVGGIIMINGIFYDASFDYGLKLKSDNAISYAIPLVYNDKDIARFVKNNIPDKTIVISAGPNDLIHSFYTDKIDYFLNGHGTSQRTKIPHIKSYEEFIALIKSHADKDVYILGAYSLYPKYSNLKDNEPFTHYSKRVQTFISNNGKIIYSTEGGEIIKINDRNNSGFKP